MLFNVERDEGSVIEGYVVPDGFSDLPGIKIMDDGVEIADLDCNRQIEAVAFSGRHDTGWVGFRLDDDNVPNLAERRLLTILDRRTGLLIYRRPQGETLVRRRVFRLETQLVPFARFDRTLEPVFQYWASGVERYGHETTLQIFHLSAVDSIYASGRILARNYEYFLDKGFDFATIIGDPYHELAERIILFRTFGKKPSGLIAERDQLIFGPLVEHFADVDITSLTALKKSLATASSETKRLLTSPLARQMASTQPDQVPSRKSLAPAMDLLSRFAVVGLRDAPETFTAPFAEYLGVSADMLPSPTTHRRVADVADMLREIPAVEMLLELDLILYHFARQVIGSSHNLSPVARGTELVWN